MIEREFKNTRNIFIAVDLILLVFSLILVCYDEVNFGIVIWTIAAISVLFTIRFLYLNRNDKLMYRSFLNSLYKTYDETLINSNELTSLEGKNVLKIDSIYDLLDAQIEIKKPIYYKEFSDYTVFLLIDNDEVCISIIKEDENKKCDYEDIIEEMKNKPTNNSAIDATILEDLANTAIIKLDNGKAVKVSPIREEVNTVEELKETVSGKREQKLLTITKCIVTKTSLCFIDENHNTTYVKFADMKACNKKFSKSIDTVFLIIKTDKCDYKIKCENNDNTKKLSSKLVKEYLKRRK